MSTKTDSITEQIHKELRMDILTGKISGGTRLAESTLAKEKGISRTPAREALQQLAREDLVYAIPRAGYVVQELSESDIIDLFETRSRIEMVAALAALENITDAELELMKNNLIKTKAVIDTNSMENMISLDTEFHEILYKATRSKYLYRICMNLSDYTLKFRQSVIIIPEVGKRARQDHIKIYEALKTRDAASVEDAIKDHLIVVKKDILGHLKTLRQQSFM